MTVFGWDDVLCPTTHAKLERKKRATQPLGVSSSKQDRKELLKVGTSVVRCVQAARRHGPVVIVTESDENWVRGTAELLLPGSAAACLQNVEVVSSRGRFGTDFPCQPACWQIAAFSYVTNRYLLSPAAAAEVGLGLGPGTGDAKTATTTKGEVLAKGATTKGAATKGGVTDDAVTKEAMMMAKDVETAVVVTKDDVPTKDVLSIGTAVATAATKTTTTKTSTATAATGTGGGGSEARQKGHGGGGVEGGDGGGGGGVGVCVGDDADGAAGGAVPPRGGGKGDSEGGDGDSSSNGSGSSDSGGRSGDGGMDGASAERNWGRGTLIAVSTAPRVWEDKSATSTLREHHPKIVAKTVSLIKAPTPLELRKQLDLLAENFGLMFGHPPPRNRARSSSRTHSRSRSRSRSRAAKPKTSHSSSSPSPSPSPSSSSTSLSSSSLSSSSPEPSPRQATLPPCHRSGVIGVDGVGGVGGVGRVGVGVGGVGGVGGRGFTQKKGIGDSDEDYAAATSSTATSSTAGRSVDGETPSPESSDWDEPPCVMRGRAEGRVGGCASGLDGTKAKEGPTVAAVAAAAGGPW